MPKYQEGHDHFLGALFSVRAAPLYVDICD